MKKNSKQKIEEIYKNRLFGVLENIDSELNELEKVRISVFFDNIKRKIKPNNKKELINFINHQ